MIETAGASLLCLPPYSPDFNPIENAFAKLKALVRKAALHPAEDLNHSRADSGMPLPFNRTGYRSRTANTKTRLGHL
jgi:transposase